jgi:AraC family transcriptional regulator of adaptative response/methylated-DNA-[protein]-cysteine methyltransferase
MRDGEGTNHRHLEDAIMIVHADTRSTSTLSTVDELRVIIKESSLGLVLVARSGAGLRAVLIGDDRHELLRDLRRRFPSAALIDVEAEHDDLADRVVAFVESPTRDLDVRLDLRGTAFQRTVWHALREIPPGSTATYTEVAHRIGMPTSARAVAQACAANALAVIIPCHRVVRSDGALSGYRWGVQRKRILLEKEATA